jgi:hypothetical protein
MEAIDGNKFRNVLRGMGRMYGAEPDGLVLDAYWIALRSWSYEDFEAACAHLMEHHKGFMPKPGHFSELRKAGRLTAGEAFAKAIGWARDGSYNAPAKTPDAIFIDRVVAAMGGWSRITGADSEKLHFLERDFAEHFTDIRDATDTREALPQIAGPMHARLAAGLKHLTSARPALEMAKP